MNYVCDAFNVQDKTKHGCMQQLMTINLRRPHLKSECRTETINAQFNDYYYFQLRGHLLLLSYCPAVMLTTFNQNFRSGNIYMLCCA